MMLIILVTSLAFTTSLAHDPLICTTHTPPIVYKVPPVNPCETGPMNETHLVVSYNRPIHMKISGWRVRIMDVTCETHFFFWGSYTHTLRHEKTAFVDFPSMEMGVACPQGTIRYTDDKALEKDICTYIWPNTAETQKKICYIDRADLLSFDGVITVEGHPVRSCQGSLCVLSSSEVFYHTKDVEPHRTEFVTHYSGPGFCNTQVCVVPTLREAYPVINIIMGPTHNTSMQYESVSGSRVWVSPPSRDSNSQSPDLPIADVSVLSKIENLDEEMSVLKMEVTHICKSIKALYSSILSLTATSPSIAASLYLNRTDIHAQFISNHLMVWPCIAVDQWTYRNSTGCTAYIPIQYMTQGGVVDGYLDPRDNRVYESSPAGPCGIHYMISGMDLIGIHQRMKNISYITRQDLDSRETGPLFDKVILKASTWAISKSAIKEAQPREFSYEDLLSPTSGSGKTWLEEEIDKSYPFMSYIVHMKTASICSILILIVVVMVISKYIFLLHVRIRRIEDSLIESIALRHLYKA